MVRTAAGLKQLVLLGVYLVSVQRLSSEKIEVMKFIGLNDC